MDKTWGFTLYRLTLSPFNTKGNCVNLKPLFSFVLLDIALWTEVRVQTLRESPRILKQYPTEMGVDGERCVLVLFLSECYCRDLDLDTMRKLSKR